MARRQTCGRTFQMSRLVELGGNLGFAAACNRGIAAGEAEIVVLLNNDVECSATFLEHLVAPFADERVGLVPARSSAPESTSSTAWGSLRIAPWPGSHGCRAVPLQMLRLHSPFSSDLPAEPPRTDVLRGRRQEGSTRRSFSIQRISTWRFAFAPQAGRRQRPRMPSGFTSARQPPGSSRPGSGTTAASRAATSYGATGCCVDGRGAARGLATEAIVVAGDAVISRDLSALRGRLAGWRSARTLPSRPMPPRECLETSVGFWESLRLRRQSYRAS